MNKRISQFILLPLTLAMLVLLPWRISLGQAPKVPNLSIALDDSTKLELVNAGTKWVEYRGRHALKLVPLPGHEHAQNEELMAILTDSDFKNGTIEVDVSGARREGYSKEEGLGGFKGMIASRFTFRTISAKLSTSAPKIPASTISCSATAPPSMSRSPIFPGISCASRAPGFTSLTSTWNQGPGRSSGSKSQGPRRGYT
jgi:hypothetical protein